MNILRERRLVCDQLDDALPALLLQAFLPLLGADLSLQGSAGKVINISSVGGKYGAPFMGAYSASKHGVEGMSDSLRRELLPYGIDVVVVGMATFLRGVPKQWSAKSEAELHRDRSLSENGPILERSYISDALLHGHVDCLKDVEHCQQCFATDL